MKEYFVKEFPSYKTCMSLLAKPLYANYKTTRKQSTINNTCEENTDGKKEIEGENDLSLMDVECDTNKHCRKDNRNKCCDKTYCMSNMKSSETLTPIEQYNVLGVCDGSKNYNRKVQFVTSSDDRMKSKQVSAKKCIEKNTKVSIEFTNTKFNKDFHWNKPSQGSVPTHESEEKSLEKVAVEDRNVKMIHVGGLTKVIPTATCHHWLRVIPPIDKDSRRLHETLFLWTLSQVGFAVLLIVWSAIWITVIYLTERPSEFQNAYELKKKENDLVIELATELRQINPLSVSWVSSIARHVATARALKTSERYFHLPGCVLFAVNVLTALGFGAPVPQSAAGQVATFIFAVIGLPAHVYLGSQFHINLLLFIVINAGAALAQAIKTSHFTKRKLRDRKSSLAAIEGMENDVRGKCEIKTVGKRFLPPFKTAWNKFVKLSLQTLQSTRCFPIIVVVYYMFGATMFGVLRSRSALDSVMFPIEFTTNGGLHNVSGEVLILYAIYLESMALLVGCTVAVLKSAAADVFSDFVAKRHVFVYAR